MSRPPLRQAKLTRSGGSYGIRAAADDDDDEDLARGTLRTGASFRRVSRGYYPTLKALEKAHRRLFTQEATFVVTGE
jgi:hypothetical protein